MTANTINDAVTMQPGAEGTLLANRYRIVRQLGQGGMGSVWLAEDTQLDGKLFAIKMLPSRLVSNKRAYRQLKDEALVAMQLVHPNIVQIRAFEENNGNPFLVMDYIDGQTLDDYLAEKGKLSEDETVRLLKPVAAALDPSHDPSLDHKRTVARLAELGIDCLNRDTDPAKKYTNSITVDLTGHLDSTSLARASVRGTVEEGNLLISRINDFDKLYVEPAGNWVVFSYADRPGVLGRIAAALGDAGLNIDDVRNPHDASGANSLALLRVNKPAPDALVAAIGDSIGARVAFHLEF